MNGRYLVDTSVLVELLRGTTRLTLPTEAEFIVCVIALGELYYGALAARRPDHQLQQLIQFLSGYSILHTSDAVAISYSELKCALKEQGTPIPENDIWIAAFAKTYQMPLLTRDMHFQHVTALGVEVVFV